MEDTCCRRPRPARRRRKMPRLHNIPENLRPLDEIYLDDIPRTELNLSPTPSSPVVEASRQDDPIVVLSDDEDTVIDRTTHLRTHTEGVWNVDSPYHRATPGSPLFVHDEAVPEQVRIDYMIGNGENAPEQDGSPGPELETARPPSRNAFRSSRLSQDTIITLTDSPASSRRFGNSLSIDLDALESNNDDDVEVVSENRVAPNGAPFQGRGHTHRHMTSAGETGRVVVPSRARERAERREAHNRVRRLNSQGNPYYETEDIRGPWGSDRRASVQRHTREVHSGFDDIAMAMPTWRANTARRNVNREAAERRFGFSAGAGNRGALNTHRRASGRRHAQQRSRDLLQSTTHQQPAPAFRGRRRSAFRTDFESSLPDSGVTRHSHSHNHGFYINPAMPPDIGLLPSSNQFHFGLNHNPWSYTNTREDYEFFSSLDDGLPARKRAPQSTIDSLPVVSATQQHAEDRCSICLCDIEEGEKMKQLPCTHVFHPDCIDSWLGRNACCPIDKSRL